LNAIVSDLELSASDFRAKPGELALLSLTPFAHYINVIAYFIHTYAHFALNIIGFVFSTKLRIKTADQR
jgi:hypothetical protein